VLVVDDDPALAEMLGIVLRTEGFEPSFVADGDRALPERIAGGRGFAGCFLNSRHSSESWNLPCTYRAKGKEMPAFAGMTDGP